MFRKFAPLIGAAVLVFVAWRVAISCGPFLPQAQFHEVNNWIDRDELLKGHIGIVRPEFFHKSLLAAYRALTQEPLTQPEVDALFPGNTQPQYGDFDPVETAARNWLDARKAVSAAAAPGSFPFNFPYTSSTSDGLQFFDNCLAGAFQTATATLKKRIALWGAQSPNTIDWLSAQDQVFSNCNQGSSIPAALPADADPTLAADRRYQIAAAEFYAKHYADALRDFDAIANDSHSEWHVIARYVAARVVIRQASLENRPDALADARTRLQAIVSDPAESPFHDSAHGLLDLVQVRQDPGAYLIKTADLLSRPGLGDEILQTFNDFNLVWNHVKPLPTNQPGLVDWIYSIQTPSAAGHAIARWRETHAPVWLVAALEHANANAPEAPDLITAATSIKPDQPAYATATYLGVRLQTERNRDAARQWIDAALATHQPTSVENEFRGERLALARNWTEFLRYAPRAPIAQSVDLPDEPLPSASPAKVLDDDSADTLSQLAPLTRIVEAAHSPFLPRNLQTEIALAGWTRAAILENAPAAKDLANLLTQFEPSLSGDLKTFLAAPDSASAHFAAMLLILRNPGLHPAVVAGFPRSDRVDQLDEYRSNWWTFAEILRVAPSTGPSKPEPTIDYLPPQELAQGRAEYAQLRKLASVAPNYLSQSAIDWARSHPSDPRVPEALALAVRATRYGITDKQTTNFSKAAFLLLHQKYPNSPWAQRTKYWF